MLRLELFRRSVVKAVTYRLLIIALDFVTIYILTGAVGVSLGFVVVSNVYTTLAYIAHERVWAEVQWGQGAPPRRPESIARSDPPPAP